MTSMFLAASTVRMPFAQALSTSIIGITIVLMALAGLALIVMLFSKLFASVDQSAKAAPVAVGAAPVAPTPAPVSKEEKPAIPAGMMALPESCSQGDLDLNNVDEPTAAQIMAIISDSSGIPLNQLRFKSIKQI